MGRPTRRARPAAAVTAMLLVAATGPAHGQDAPTVGVRFDDDAPTVLDPLADAAPPAATEIADTIRPLEPVVSPIEVPEPRSLRGEVEEGDRTTLTIATDVLFAFDSAQLSPRAERTLRDLASEVDDADGTVLVVGHTDSTGTDAYNQDLSERRAEAVAAVLADVLGGDVEITTEGRGEQEPVAEEGDGDPSAAARNRRVEIVFES